MNNEVVKIQSAWRSYKVRRKIDNIFIKLPDDLQKLVAYHLNREDRLRRLYKTLYYKKICKLESKLVELYYKFLTENNMYFEDYISERIIITGTIEYFTKKLSEIV